MLPMMDRKEIEAILDERLEKRQSRRRRWLRSPWRVAPPLVAAYIGTGIYYTFAHPTNPWSRAMGPVITVVTALIVRSLIQRRWFKREQERNEQDDMI
ncbi:MAG: hypothetical protein RLZZ416_796 [Candidatus Parcubacteria bacterium]|jgi:phosphate/sulfate permease